MEGTDEVSNERSGSGIPRDGGSIPHRGTTAKTKGDLSWEIEEISTSTNP